MRAPRSREEILADVFVPNDNYVGSTIAAIQLCLEVLLDIRDELRAARQALAKGAK